MLTAGRCGRPTLRATQGRRGFFDLLAQAQAAGKDGSVSAAPRKQQQFSWEWMEWFEQNDQQVITGKGWDKMRKYLSARNVAALAATKPTAKVNWDDWRNKIKDPAFVEELRAKYCADMDIAMSRTSPAQELTWSKEGLAARTKELQAELTHNGINMTEEETLDFFCKGAEQQAAKHVDWAKEVDAKYVDARRARYLEYEQVEAERDLFGIRGEMIHYAEHPQVAEAVEEAYAGKQTYSDKILFEHEFHRFHKRERLAQMQDDTERQVFLERYKDTIKLYGHPGMEA